MLILRSFLDYSFFYTATQAFQIHLYSTQDAPLLRHEPSQRYPRRANALRSMGYVDPEDEAGDMHSLRKIKTVQGVQGVWTITDSDLSRDNEWCVFHLFLVW